MLTLTLHRMGYSITRQELDAQPVKILSRGRNWTKAQVRLVRWNSRSLVVKDMRAAHPLFRVLVGWWLIRHEQIISRELSGIRGIPGSISRIDRYAFARAFVEGKPLSTFQPGEVPAGIFLDLERIVRAVHGRGIAHGDIHHRDIIVNGVGESFLIDFATAMRRGRWWNLPKKWLFQQYCRIDLRSVFKLKSRFLKEPLPSREAQFLLREPVLHRMGKWVRKFFRPEKGKS